MALYIGDTLISGEIEGQKLNLPFSLFQYQWSSFILNNASWLRADTFSWQSGAVYVSAYEQLLTEYNEGTSETAEGITYRLTSTGKKIALADQETAIISLYASTGAALYYILDTENERFKLPRGLHGTVVQSYQNGTDWYRIYSDGWCEQGGHDDEGNTDYGTRTITLLKPFIDTNYNVLITGITTNTSSSDLPMTMSGIKAKTVNNFTRTTSTSTYRTDGIDWQACGYISGDFNDMEKYLYFYVGETVQNANILNPIANALDAIPISNISYSASLSLATNTAYTLTLSGDITFILPNPEAGKLNQIEVQIYMATAYTIGLGTSYFFGGGAPDMSEAGYYSIMYEYDWLQQHWVVGALKKGASS